MRAWQRLKLSADRDQANVLELASRQQMIGDRKGRNKKTSKSSNVVPRQNGLHPPRTAEALVGSVRTDLAGCGAHSANAICTAPQ